MFFLLLCCFSFFFPPLLRKFLFSILRYVFDFLSQAGSNQASASSTYFISPCRCGRTIYFAFEFLEATKTKVNWKQKLFFFELKRCFCLKRSIAVVQWEKPFLAAAAWRRKLRCWWILRLFLLNWGLQVLLDCEVYNISLATVVLFSFFSFFWFIFLTACIFGLIREIWICIERC